jgi:AraC-like DNA-binding protein
MDRHPSSTSLGTCSQAALEIECEPGVDHADLAVRLGWYDQAHFINDFRAMLGTTPGEYAAAHGS